MPDGAESGEVPIHGDDPTGVLRRDSSQHRIGQKIAGRVGLVT